MPAPVRTALWRLLSGISKYRKSPAVWNRCFFRHFPTSTVSSHDDHGQTVFLLHSSAFGTKLGNADTGGIVDHQLGLADDTGTLDQSFPFLVIQLAGTELLGIHAGFQGKHTIDQLLLTHFQTEYGYRQILLKCYMLRDIQYKCRLTHGRTGCDQHQVRGLHSGGTIVQINESGGNTCDGSVQFGSLLDLVHGVHDYGTNRYEFLDVFSSVPLH